MFLGRTAQAARECGDGGGGELKGCCLKWLMFSTSWVIAMDRYVIITLCYVLRLGCCAVMGWGLQRDEAASTDLDRSLVEKNPKENTRS